MHLIIDQNLTTLIINQNLKGILCKNQNKHLIPPFPLSTQTHSNHRNTCNLPYLASTEQRTKYTNTSRKEGKKRKTRERGRVRRVTRQGRKKRTQEQLQALENIVGAPILEAWKPMASFQSQRTQEGQDKTLIMYS